MVALLGVAAPAATARAAPDEAKVKAGDRLDKVGKAHYKNQNYADAVVAFEAAFEANPLPKYLFNLAKCHEKAGNLSEAIGAYERYVTLAPGAQDAEDVTAVLTFIKAKLRKTKGELKITARPEGATVKLDRDGRTLEGSTPYDGWIDPGEYTVRVLRKGYQPFERDVRIEAGATVKLEAVLVEVAPPPNVAPTPPKAEPSPPRAEPPPPAPVAAKKPEPEPEAEPEPPAAAAAPGGDAGEEDGDEVAEEGSGFVAESFKARPEPGEAPGVRWLPWVVVGTGVALLGGGAMFGVKADATVKERLALEDESKVVGGRPVPFEEIQAKDEDARAQAALATILYFAGGAATLGGVALLFLGGGDPAPASVVPTPGGALLTFGGTL